MNHGNTGMLLDVRIGFFDLEIIGPIGEPLKHGESCGLDRLGDLGGLLGVGDLNNFAKFVFDLRRQVEDGLASVGRKLHKFPHDFFLREELAVEDREALFVQVLLRLLQRDRRLSRRGNIAF